ncbi:MAG: HU family DNA-binding protein [Bacteroidales bacterium]|nr:HU family DNA-binding protein [Bacteroidales bacterium]
MISNKELISLLSNQLSRDNKDMASLFDGMIQVLCERLKALDSIAIPGFGEFVANKEDETISVDYSTGKRLLLPPQITITFKASTIIKKKINK